MRKWSPHVCGCCHPLARGHVLAYNVTVWPFILICDILHTHTHTTRLVSLSQFRSLEGLLCTPDATSRLAFLLFDIEKKGRVNFGKLAIKPHPLLYTVRAGIFEEFIYILYVSDVHNVARTVVTVFSNGK